MGLFFMKVSVFKIHQEIHSCWCFDRNMCAFIIVVLTVHLLCLESSVGRVPR